MNIDSIETMKAIMHGIDWEIREVYSEKAFVNFVKEMETNFPEENDSL